jgi:hypothetical protein
MRFRVRLDWGDFFMTSVFAGVIQFLLGIKYIMRFQVLTASMKMTTFWDIGQCSLVGIV